MIRITGGIFRGQKLITLESIRTRPTPSILRESLFNIIGKEVENEAFLDLYAGFGVVGIEAISRGARPVFFVESSFKSASAIKRNLKNLKIKESTQIFIMKTERALKIIPTYSVKFKFIFMDPPYHDCENIEDIFKLIVENNLLKEEGKIFFQHFKKITPPSLTEWELLKTYKYGENYLSVFKQRK